MNNADHDSQMLRSLLNQGGFRLTTQRQKILDLFRAGGAEHHLNADEIHQLLTAQGEHIGFSTIYRALHMLVKVGLLRELELSSSKKTYELNAPYTGEHHHLVCVQCGDVLEFEENMMAEVGANQAETRGFALLDCQFTVYGVCPRCQQKPPRFVR